MQILLFGGFLGSGKTTIMLQVAKYITAIRQETVAIIENEIGANGIDDKLFLNSGLKVKRLFGGCVCCQISSDLIRGVNEIHETVNPAWVMIEMTGLAYPAKTVKALEKYCSVFSGLKTITIVDRGRWSELTTLLKPLVLGQVEGSDLIILNKVDLSGQDIPKIEQDLRAINNQMKIVLTSAANELSPGVLEEVVRFE
ncbi:GTP-binding protein [Sporomusa aerivorans]|uniref:GTP-binding protein n=1 Tax=Sporomusa aerivorans TaxID=204936 RepID=UPI00352AC302